MSITAMIVFFVSASALLAVPGVAFAEHEIIAASVVPDETSSFAFPNDIPPNPLFKHLLFEGTAQWPVLTGVDPATLFIDFDYIDPDSGEQVIVPAASFDIEPQAITPLMAETMLPFCPERVSIHFSVEEPILPPVGIAVNGEFWHTCVPFPEPSTLVLAGLGLPAVVAFGRRRRRRKAASVNTMRLHPSDAEIGPMPPTPTTDGGAPYVLGFLLTTVALALTAIVAPPAVHAAGLVDFDGTETGLLSYSNPTYSLSGGASLGTDALEVSSNGFGSSTWFGGDSAWPMTRADVGPNTIGMPFNVSDDSVAAAAGNSVFAADVLGFAGTAKTDGFFGITDTVNSANPGNSVTVDFEFDITGMPSIVVSADFAAMGDFETADMFDFTYSIDASPFSALFTSSVDETGSQTYSMDSGAGLALDDPVLINGVQLNDTFRNIAAPVLGTGSSLVIRLVTQTDGPEGFGFDNLRVAVPEPASLLLAALGLPALVALGPRRRR